MLLYGVESSLSHTQNRTTFYGDVGYLTVYIRYLHTTMV